MTGLDAILESIRKDGRENAETITQKARTEADGILEEAKKEAQRRREAILRDAPQQAQDAADRVLSADICGIKDAYVLGEADRKRMPADFPKKLENVLPKGASLTVSDTPSPSVEGGFLLIYGGIEENCTFRALFDAKREALQDIANQILFAG